MKRENNYVYKNNYSFHGIGPLGISFENKYVYRENNYVLKEK